MTWKYEWSCWLLLLLISLVLYPLFLSIVELCCLDQLRFSLASENLRFVFNVLQFQLDCRNHGVCLCSGWLFVLFILRDKNLCNVGLTD